MTGGMACGEGLHLRGVCYFTRLHILRNGVSFGGVHVQGRDMELSEGKIMQFKRIFKDPSERELVKLGTIGQGPRRGIE